MDNRSHILQVALRLFATHGYDAIGVQQIVTDAGVTKPTLYHYFQSKQGLFETLVAEKSAPLLLELEEVSRYRGDLVLSITQVTQFYFDFLHHDRDFYRLVLVHWFMPPTSEVYHAVADLQQRQFALLEKLFLDATPQHGNMRGRHQQYAVSLKGMIDTYIGLSLRGTLQLDNGHMVYRLVHQFMHGIFS